MEKTNIMELQQQERQRFQEAWSSLEEVEWLTKRIKNTIIQADTLATWLGLDLSGIQDLLMQ